MEEAITIGSHLNDVKVYRSEILQELPLDSDPVEEFALL
jgi:hypothetical protein